MDINFGICRCFVFVALEVDTHLHGQLQEDGEKPEAGQFRYFLTQVAKVTKVQADNLKKKESSILRTLTVTKQMYKQTT